MSFHKSVNQKLEKLNSFEDTINYINSLNDIILHLLEKRSQYPACMDHFSKRKGGHQKMLESYNIDTVWWHPVYSKIVEKICPEGKLAAENVYDVIDTESQLERFVYERIMIGRKVAEYKKPRGMDRERKDRESEIIEYVRNEAPEYKLNPDAVEEIFLVLIKKNKHIQSLCKPIKTNELKEIKSCKTQGIESVNKLKKSFAQYGNTLSQQTGNQYHVIVEEVPPLSIVKLLEE